MTSSTLSMEAAPRKRFQPFSREAIQFALIVGLLPNLFFLVAMPFYIAERLLAPLLFLVAGLLAFVVPRWAIYLLFLVAAFVDLGLIIATAFHLPVGTALKSMRYMASIDVGASSFYLAVVTIMIGTALATAWLMARNRARLRNVSPVPATIAALLLMLLDLSANFPFVEGRSDGLPFDSAISRTGLTADRVAANGNNLLVVLVEGMGAFADPADRGLITRSLRLAANRSGYRFETGTTHYSGSTTGGESRELCGRWGDYVDYLPKGDYDCLPRRLARKGYQSIAYHGFVPSMFSRDHWYPQIGFARLNFKKDILRDHGRLTPSSCGSVFLGLCDNEVASVVRRELTAPSRQPKFVYWLTLNSHVPFVPKTRGGLGCSGARPRIDNRTVCQLGEYWVEVMEQVAAIASDPALPPTDILIVGDHHTPLWERAAKNKFLLGKVDWFLLRHQRPVQRINAGNSADRDR
ncbi:sulfatase-like hydrolase/transferase [Sphingosinicella rhizophila]|uniref:Sulfatase N-terminal domain-containing protein n=1 Tax=Sphingosinicella rhizophila TaxID=3050082 RepID=A0ABU3Q3N2_9SPHN|nr:sulfatase-like hydrolase/transferase [Sphingosinicella sp. GR2756]MDT9598023.1 hypothetical protein [Sphingosinicella sp. GR2756]